MTTLKFEQAVSSTRWEASRLGRLPPNHALTSPSRLVFSKSFASGLISEDARKDCSLGLLEILPKRFPLLTSDDENETNKECERIFKRLGGYTSFRSEDFLNSRYPEIDEGTSFDPPTNRVSGDDGTVSYFITAENGETTFVCAFLKKEFAFVINSSPNAPSVAKHLLRDFVRSYGGNKRVYNSTTSEDGGGYFRKRLATAKIEEPVKRRNKGPCIDNYTIANIFKNKDSEECLSDRKFTPTMAAIVVFRRCELPELTKVITCSLDRILLNVSRPETKDGCLADMKTFSTLIASVCIGFVDHSIIPSSVGGVSVHADFLTIHENEHERIFEISQASKKTSAERTLVDDVVTGAASAVQGLLSISDEDKDITEYFTRVGYSNTDYDWWVETFAELLGSQSTLPIPYFFSDTTEGIEIRVSGNGKDSDDDSGDGDEDEPLSDKLEIVAAGTSETVIASSALLGVYRWRFVNYSGRANIRGVSRSFMDDMVYEMGYKYDKTGVLFTNDGGILFGNKQGATIYTSECQSDTFRDVEIGGIRTLEEASMYSERSPASYIVRPRSVSSGALTPDDLIECILASRKGIVGGVVVATKDFRAHIATTETFSGFIRFLESSLQKEAEMFVRNQTDMRSVWRFILNGVKSSYSDNLHDAEVSESNNFKCVGYHNDLVDKKDAFTRAAIAVRDYDAVIPFPHLIRSTKKIVVDEYNSQLTVFEKVVNGLTFCDILNSGRCEDNQIREYLRCVSNVFDRYIYLSDGSNSSRMHLFVVGSI